MQDPQQKPRVAVLGAREAETELLAELHRQGNSELIALYDPDPQALGLPLAEIMGIPAGSDRAARDRLQLADVVVLPRDRMAFREDVEWCSGLRAELIGLDAARQRWGSIGSTPGARANAPQTEDVLEELHHVGQRLQSPERLADWLLEITMPAIGATGGSIQLLSSNGEELYLIAARGLSEHTVHNSRRPLGEAISGMVATTRRPQVMHGEHQAHLQRDRDPIHSAICLPLELEDKTLIGVLNLSTSVHGQHFAETHVHILQRLAPRCAKLLHQALVQRGSQDHDLENRLHQLVQTLGQEDLDLQSNLKKLCSHTQEQLGASRINLYVAALNGEWLPLIPTTERQPGTLAHSSRATASRALLERRWILKVQTPDQPPMEDSDFVDTSVNQALQRNKPEDPGATQIYAPLVGSRPLGILTAEFATSSAAERFMQVGVGYVRDLSFYLESRLQEERANDRIQRLSLLARTMPALLEAQQENRIEQEVLEQAMRLVSAQRAAFRWVDMKLRRYSPPISRGIPEEEMETWRKHDAIITETTLQKQETVLTATVAEEDDLLDKVTGVHSLASVPIKNDSQLLGVLNLYDKVAHAPWDERVFGEFDRELLDGLALLLASILKNTPHDTKQASPDHAPAKSHRAPGDPATKPQEG